MTVVASTLATAPLPPGIPPRCNDAREQFLHATKGLLCKDIFHVHFEQCPSAWLDMCWACSRGSARYFLPFYAIHLIWNGRKTISLDREFYKDLVVYYLRSIVFGTTMGTTFAVTSCIITRSLGGYSYWANVFIPGTLAGLSIFFEHPHRRRIVLNTFYNMALQYLYIRAQLANFVHRTAAKETVCFMAVNAALLYLLRTARNRSSVFWFFIPERQKSPPDGQNKRMKTACPMQHDGSCLKYAVKNSAKYFLLAGALQALRAVLATGSALAKRPSLFFRHLLSRTTAAGFLSIGGYVLLYKIVMCELARARGKDSPIHAVPAGLVAGAAYRLQPNVTLLTSAVVSTIALISDRVPYLRPPQNWKVPELLFALCNGMLFHARCMDMSHCPQFIVHMMDTATRNRSRTIYHVYMDLISQIPISAGDHISTGPLHLTLAKS